jgi:tRNA nucleotidyltransferase (CCA-adding enzyme)
VFFTLSEGTSQLAIEQAKLSRIFAQASALVTPSPEEEKSLEETVANVSASLRRISERRGFSVIPEFVVGGSYAKGTWLKGQADVDFYLLYPPDYLREKLETEAISFAKLAVEGYEINMRYAEHPYVEAFVDKTRVNLVPCYKVKKGDWKSAADRSPFHLEYIKARFNDKLRLEARLLKKFVKSIGVYGAEVKTHGFSGYVCEVLTLKFGSFASVLEQLSNTRSWGRVISVEEFDQDYVATSFDSAIVILDPVDTTRNLGGAISVQSLAKLIFQSRKFLSDPSLRYFETPSGNRGTGQGGGLKKRNGLVSKTIIVRFKNKPRSVDILWGQLQKSLGAIKGRLEEKGFQVLRSLSASDEHGQSAFVFLFRSTVLDEFNEREGPEYFRVDEVERFVEKNREKALLLWIASDDKGRIRSLFKRNSADRDALKTIRNILTDSRELDSLGLSKAIRQELRQGVTIETGDRLLWSVRKKPPPWIVNAVKEATTTAEVFL